MKLEKLPSQVSLVPKSLKLNIYRWIFYAFTKFHKIHKLSLGVNLVKPVWCNKVSSEFHDLQLVSVRWNLWRQFSTLEFITLFGRLPYRWFWWNSQVRTNSSSRVESLVSLETSHHFHDKVVVYKGFLVM